MKKIVCSGALLYAKNSQRFLFLHRAQGKNGNLWGLAGETNEASETPWTGLVREIKEEIGCIDIIKSIPLETFVSNDDYFLFHTYLCIVEHEFLPILNQEHDGYAWVKLSMWPKPLHPGLRNTLNTKINQAKLQTVINLIQLLEKNNDELC